MDKYVIARSNRKHLVVDKNVHVLILLYCREESLSVTEATYRLLKLGLSRAIGAEIPDSEIDKYRIIEPLAERLSRWFRKDRG